MAFVTLRQQTMTLQGVVVVGGIEGGDGPVVSKQMLKFVNAIPVSLEVVVVVSDGKMEKADKLANMVLVGKHRPC